jgi:hypothetical protein
MVLIRIVGLLAVAGTALGCAQKLHSIHQASYLFKGAVVCRGAACPSAFRVDAYFEFGGRRSPVGSVGTGSNGQFNLLLQDLNWHSTFSARGEPEKPSVHLIVEPSGCEKASLLVNTRSLAFDSARDRYYQEDVLLTISCQASK